jgi:hypothetical protein
VIAVTRPAPLVKGGLLQPEYSYAESPAGVSLTWLLNQLLGKVTHGAVVVLLDACRTVGTGTPVDEVRLSQIRSPPG